MSLWRLLAGQVDETIFGSKQIQTNRYMLTFEPITLTPTEFEEAVRAILDGAGVPLRDYKSEHLPSLSGVDGDYVIDVAVTFSALGADFLVLVECKHEKRRTERQDVQILHSKVQSLRAQNGMLFSTAALPKHPVPFPQPPR